MWDGADLPLARFGGERPPAPAWYEEARAMPVTRLQAAVRGAGIEVLAWGERGRPGLLLIHGARAHASWWNGVAPLLARDYRVAALSFSGMGGSDWRDHYDAATQVEEIFAAAEVAGLFDAGPPVLIAHSFGANATAIAAQGHGHRLAGTILIDTGINSAPLDALPINPPRIWPDLATILGRFRLAPPEETDLPALLHDVARAGVVEENGYWRWRFDPDYWSKLTFSTGWEAIGSPRCPLGIIFGEQSEIATVERIAGQRRQAPAGTAFVSVPQAGHHIMLQQPIALTVAIRAMIWAWLATPAGAPASNDDKP